MKFNRARHNVIVPKDVTEDRMVVSGDVLDMQYNMAAPDEKRLCRKENFDQFRYPTESA